MKKLPETLWIHIIFELNPHLKIIPTLKTLADNGVFPAWLTVDESIFDIHILKNTVAYID